MAFPSRLANGLTATSYFGDVLLDATNSITGLLALNPDNCLRVAAISASPTWAPSPSGGGTHPGAATIESIGSGDTAPAYHLADLRYWQY